MSFDVFCVRFVDGEAAEADRHAVQSVLQRYQYDDPSGTGICSVTIPDGGCVEITAAELLGSSPFMGCTFFIRHMTEGVLQFMFAIAKAGDMMMFPAMEGNPCVLTDPSQRASVPGDLDFSVVESQSPQELGVLLSEGYEAWECFRNRILGTPDKAEEET